MSDENEATAEQTSKPGMRETFGLDRYQFTRGKIALVALAIAMMLAGGGLALLGNKPSTMAGPVAVEQSGETPAETDPENGLMTSFAQNGESTSPPSSGTSNADASGTSNRDSASDIGAQDFSKLFVKGGFGLFVGFAMGFAIRAFVKLATVIVGFYLLTLTILAQLGWVEIHWTVIETDFNGVVSNLGAQFQSLKAFLTGSLPSSGLTATGLAAGLRQK